VIIFHLSFSIFHLSSEMRFERSSNLVGKEWQMKDVK